MVKRRFLVSRHSVTGGANSAGLVPGIWGLFALVGLLSSASCGTPSDDGAGPDEVPEIPEAPEPEIPTSLRLVFDHIDVPEADNGTDFVFLPMGTSGDELEILMTSRDGFLWHLSFEEQEAQVLSRHELSGATYKEDACGPTNLLLDPDFEDNAFFYVSYCSDAETTLLTRFTWRSDEGPRQPTPIFSVTQSGADSGWHRFGSMGFEEGGVLWMTVGDHKFADEALNLRNNVGSLVRLIPGGEDGQEGYRIPEGNFLSVEGSPQSTHPANFAFGFRSPWRATRDKKGRYFVGDAGEDSFEELNLVTRAGQNFGWNDFEGPCPLDCGDAQDPLIHYSRDEDHAFLQEETEAQASTLSAIWVGEIYEDSPVDRYHSLMDDVVAYGDIYSGFIRGLRLGPEDELKDDMPIGFLSHLTQWRVGPDGFIYALDLGSQLHRARLDFGQTH